MAEQDNSGYRYLSPERRQRRIRELEVRQKEKQQDLSLLNELADLYREDGRYREALKIRQEILAAHQKNQSKDSADIAESYYDIVVLYSDPDEYNRAKELLEKPLRFSSRPFRQVAPILKEPGTPCAPWNRRGDRVGRLGGFSLMNNLYCLCESFFICAII